MRKLIKISLFLTIQRIFSAYLVHKIFDLGLPGNSLAITMRWSWRCFFHLEKKMDFYFSICSVYHLGNERRWLSEWLSVVLSVWRVIVTCGMSAKNTWGRVKLCGSSAAFGKIYAPLTVKKWSERNNEVSRKHRWIHFPINRANRVDRRPATCREKRKMTKSLRFCIWSFDGVGYMVRMKSWIWVSAYKNILSIYLSQRVKPLFNRKGY